MESQSREEYSKKYYLEHREQKLAYQRSHEVRERIRQRKRQQKYDIFAHYSDGKVTCAHCGESRLACLSLDHIDGSGRLQRRELKKQGSEFYQWLKRNNYPTGFQVLCMNCQWIKRETNGEVKIYAEST